MTASDGRSAASQPDIVLELVERCLSGAIRVARTAFVPPRFNSADDYRFQTADDLALFIAGNHPPADRLVRGLREQLGRLRAAIHWKEKKLSLTELRDLAEKVHQAATCLQRFPKLGQLPKHEMAEAYSAIETLRGFLNNSELLSYVFKDGPPILDASLSAALAIISERARWATIRTVGAPKKQPDMEIPNWDQFGAELDYVAHLSRAAADREKIKQRMSLRAEAESGPAKKRDPYDQRFSPQLLCAVIVGVAYSTASTKVHRLKREITFPKNTDEACEMLWRAAGGEWHDLITETGHRYWDEHRRAAPKPACLKLVRAVSDSFR
jgi:hypothetical protein